MIRGIFRRDAGQNAPLLRHKTKGKSRMMNKFQARKFYRKMFANYPDVLTVEDATNLLGFKSQTGVIRRIHQNRIRYLKVGWNFMIPKEYLIDYLLSDWFHTGYIILHSALLFQCQGAVRFYFFRQEVKFCTAIRTESWKNSMILDYFYGQAGDLFSFYRIPKALFQEPRFRCQKPMKKTEVK